MAKKLTPEQAKAFARYGAATRLRELDEEAAAIRAAFPDLVAPAARPLKTNKAAKPARKKRVFSAKERRAISQRFKAYWAAKRTAQRGGQSSKAAARKRGRKRAAKR